MGIVGLFFSNVTPQISVLLHPLWLILQSVSYESVISTARSLYQSKTPLPCVVLCGQGRAGQRELMPSGGINTLTYNIFCFCWMNGPFLRLLKCFGGSGAQLPLETANRRSVSCHNIALRVEKTGSGSQYCIWIVILSKPPLKYSFCT